MSPIENLEYLTRAFSREAHAAVQKAAEEQRAITRTLAARGLAQSGAALKEVADAHTKTFVETAKRMIGIAFEFGGDRDTGCSALERGLKSLDRALSDHLAAFFRKQPAAFAPRATDAAKNLYQVEVERLIPGFVDDFRHDMLDGKRMTKGDSIVAIMNNSPGAMQQVGRDNRQTVVRADRAQVEAALVDFLQSPEVAKLSAAEQQSLIDVAEVIGEAVAAPERDEGKIKRWGGRLLQLARDLGVEVAAAGISLALFG